MTKAPTTRETADHAELARIAEQCRLKADKLGCDEWRAPALLKQASRGLETLLSEIAALRGERDEWRVNYDRATRLHGSTCRDLSQAERQRDELRKALEEIADEAPYRSGYCQSDVEYGPALSADEMQAVARQALANQGAE